MKVNLTWYVLFAVTAAYVAIVAIFPFEGLTAISIHFTRATVSVAALIIFIRELPTLFRELPTPQRDYAIGSINFFLISLVHFSILNEATRLFGSRAVDNNVFTGYLAGAGSMYAIVACVLALFTVKTGYTPKIIAIAVALVVAFALVFIAPLFR